MFATLLARTVQVTAAIVSAALLTAYVTVLPVPAQASMTAATSTAQR